MEINITYSLDEILDTIMKYTDEWSLPTIKFKKLKEEIEAQLNIHIKGE